MTFYDFNAIDNSGNKVHFDAYRGKVVLIVNTATKCGLTPQYEALEALYKKYRGEGFEILDFPCNQFLEQAPGTDEEINEFCTLNYATSFTRFKKIDVKGHNQAPLFTWLLEQNLPELADASHQPFVDKLESLGQKAVGDEIKWNFSKFLIDRDGNLVARFSPTYSLDVLEQNLNGLLWAKNNSGVCSAEFLNGCQY